MELNRQSTRQRSTETTRVTSLENLNARLALAAGAGEGGDSAGLLVLELHGLAATATSELERSDVLTSVARVMRQGDAIAWVDERTVAVLLTSLSSWDDARVVAERIRSSLERNAAPGDVLLGVALLGGSGVSGAELWGEARRDLEQTSAPGSRLRRRPVETLRVRDVG